MSTRSHLSSVRIARVLLVKHIVSCRFSFVEMKREKKTCVFPLQHISMANGSPYMMKAYALYSRTQMLIHTYTHTHMQSFSIHLTCMLTRLLSLYFFYFAVNCIHSARFKCPAKHQAVQRIRIQINKRYACTNSYYSYT